MEFLVEDCLRLWKDIPGAMLTEAVEDAIVQSGSYVATAGLVAKLWRDRRDRLPVHDCAALGRRDKEDETRFLAAPGANPPTAEEAAENARIAAEISRRLLMGGAA